MSINITQQLELLPATPGVYLFKNVDNAVLYVGKAKVLRNRVRSYFHDSAALEAAKQQMVQKIISLETISTDTEHEALVLEANLIQKHQPPYNVILRDDKYYLFIKITKEEWPRVFFTRRLNKDGARYFGPYSSAQRVRATLKLLRRIFPHRDEKDSPHEVIFPHPLFASSSSRNPEPNVVQGEFATNISHSTYLSNIQHIIHFLRGDRADVIATLRRGMEQAATEKSYERAALWRDQLQAVEQLESEQKVYLTDKRNTDIISIARDVRQSAANVFSIRAGKLLTKNTFLLRHRATATPADIVRQFLLQYYGVAQDIPPTIAVPLVLEDETALRQWINKEKPPQFIVPRRGRLKGLLDMGETNAKQLLQTDNVEFLTTKRRGEALTELAKALSLTDNTLHRIETYDISNIQGKLATGSMVVFEDGVAKPQQYKRFRIRLGETPNDFAMLQEVLARRFATRNAEWPVPNLIMIDGGKGQLSAAKAILDHYKLTIPLISIAKKEEELFVPARRNGGPGKSESIRLPHDSEALYLVQRMRDEAHRFTITYHRLLRSKQQKRSILSEVPGIGSNTRRKLLNHFGSLKAIRAASDAELEQLIGSKAKVLRDYL